MIVRVIFFAAARDVAGESSIEIALSENSTLSELKNALVAKFPEFERIMSHCAFSVDEEYSEDERVLKNGCEIACIPPVSGG